MKHLLLVDSRDRINSSDPTHKFAVALPYPIYGVKEVSLLETSIPINVYNIRSGINNVLRFNDNGTVRTITLTPKSYLIATFVTALQTLMNASGTSNTFAVTFDADTFKLTFTSTATLTLLFSDTTCPWRECGFPNTDTSASTSITSPYAVNLSMPSTLLIHVPEIQHSCVQTTHQAMALPSFIVPILESATYVDAQSHSQSFALSQPVNLSVLNVNLYLRNGERCDLQNSDWNFTMMLTTD